MCNFRFQKNPHEFVKSFSYKQNCQSHALFLNRQMSFNSENSNIQNYSNLSQATQEVNDGDEKRSHNHLSINFAIIIKFQGIVFCFGR